MLLKMRNALKEYRFVSHGDLIEQNQMLVNLSHVTHMRNDWQPELSRQQANRKKLRNAGDSGQSTCTKCTTPA